MRFFIRKRRQTPSVIIVALIDVLIVLVIFLLVTTTFKQRQYIVRLAESSQAQKTGANENAVLVVNIDTNGIYSIGSGKLPVTLDQLKGRLMTEAATNSQLILAINADENAPWGKVVKVRDAAAEAKIKTLVAYTKEAARP